jgi:hypothetical protein
MTEKFEFKNFGVLFVSLLFSLVIHHLLNSKIRINPTLQTGISFIIFTYLWEFYL